MACRACRAARCWSTIDLRNDLNLYYVVMGIFALGYFSVDLAHRALAVRPGAQRGCARTSRAPSRWAMTSIASSWSPSCCRPPSPAWPAPPRRWYSSRPTLSGRNLANVRAGHPHDPDRRPGHADRPILGAFIVVLLENKVGDFGQMLTRLTGPDWFLRLGESVTIVIGLIFVVCGNGIPARHRGRTGRCAALSAAGAHLKRGAAGQAGP